MFERITKRLKATFANITSVSSGSTQIAAQKNIVQQITGNWIELSKFDQMTKPAIFAQFMTMEPEIGGAVDKYGTLTSQAFKGVYVKHGNKLDPKEERMLQVAKELEETMKIKDHFEAIAEMLIGQGNCYIIPNKDMTITYLPAEYVSIIEDMDQLGSQSAITIMTKPKYLVINERNLQELEQKVYGEGKYIHLKYKETPQIVTDILGRKTFGFYATSPLERTIMYVWWKRQITILDTMWRYRNLPRDHHQIKADVYSLEKYSGETWAAKRAAAKSDADTFINSYTGAIANQAPDQGYVSLDTIDIKRIGGDSVNMGTNELIKQIEDHIWTALSIPPSSVNGTGAGSYASEVMISNNVSGKVVQLALKIKPVLLKLMRDRLLAIDSSFPVHELDFKIELSLAASDMENMRQMVLMAGVPIFTETELRKKVGYDGLTDDDRDSIVTSNKLNKASKPEEEDTLIPSDNYPETENSKGQHTRDASQNALRKDELSQPE